MSYDFFLVMNAEELKARINQNEFRFSTSRSGGPGGQNVNKVETRIELRFNIPGSSSLTGSEKELVLKILKNRINSDGDLLITSQSERTQLQNKKKSEEIFFRLLAKALTIRPPRKPTGPTKASKAKRLDEKKKRGNIKTLRKVSGIDDQNK